MRLGGNARDRDGPVGVQSFESFPPGPPMRAKHTALVLTAGFLLIPTLTWSQGPGGRGDRGGFGGGQWNGGAPGGAPWAGQGGDRSGGGDRLRGGGDDRGWGGGGPLCGGRGD